MSPTTRPTLPATITHPATIILMAAAGLSVLPGCAAAVPIVSAATAGAAASEAGYSFWRSGMLTYVDEGTIEEMNRAVAITIDRLALQIRETKDKTEDGVIISRWWSIRSDRGHLVTIKVEPLTGAMIEVEIDAGRFGNRAAAELIADRFKSELDAIQASVAPGVTPSQTPAGAVHGSRSLPAASGCADYADQNA